MIDPTGAIRGTINYTEYKAVVRHRGVGTWKVTCPLNPTHWQAASAGWRIHIAGPDGTVIAGPIRRARLTVPGGRQPRMLALEGTDDMRWLEKRLAWPSPAQPVASQGQAYDVRTGVASTIIRAYVDANAGPGAQASRQVPGLTLAADPVIGANVTGRARFNRLPEVLETLAIAGAVDGTELGYRVVSGFGLAKSFEVYLPQDKRGPARFSIALRNLKSLSWELVAPEATVMIGGGRGEETARDFVIASNILEEDDWGRLEEFFDDRSASDSDGLAELTQGNAARLDERAAVRTVEVEPVDTPRLRYGEHYGLGDLVTVDIYDGIRLEAVIREVEISSARRTGRVVKPRVGTMGAAPRGRTVPDIRDLTARVRRLEQR